jgi:hypothetical protein
LASSSGVYSQQRRNKITFASTHSPPLGLGGAIIRVAYHKP